MKSYVKNLNKLIFIILAVLVLVALFAMPCYAVNNGNLEFTAISSNDNKKITNLEVVVYKIGYSNNLGEIVLDNELKDLLGENYVLEYTEEIITKIADYVKSNYEMYSSFKTDSAGKYNTDSIEEGLYLFVQNDSFETCTMQNSIAVIKQNELTKVFPKIVSIIPEKPTDNPIEPLEEGDKTDDEKLPNTGILYWPIPVFSILGILVFAVGWYIVYASNSKKKIGFIVIVISGIFILVSGGLLIYNNLQDKYVYDENLIVTDKIEEEIKNTINSVNNAIDNNVSLVPKTYIEYNGNKYIGILHIPSLNNLRIPVLATCNDDNLKKSACKYSGNVDNKLVIAGHNYKSLFGKLLDINNLNEIIYFENLNGEFLKYKLIDIANLQVDEVKRMKEENYDLTLFTCTLGNEYRRTLRFERV